MGKNFRKKILKNGMTILFEKRNLPVVSVAFAVRNGGINESAKEKGISHFIEHMLYKGTKKRDSQEISGEIEKNGGILNGFTDETVTAFWCKMPSKHINVALDVLSDMIKNPKFDEKEIDKERKVIFEEIKMRKDAPMIYVSDEIQNLLYEKPLGLNLIGTYETMNSLAKKQLVERFNETYTPGNLILCVVGNADFYEIAEFAEKNFRKKEGKTRKLIVEEKNGKRTEKRKGLNQSCLIFAYHVPLYSDGRNYAAQVLSTLMAEGMSSRLFMEIREKRNLAYAVKGNSSINRDFAYNSIFIGTTKDKINLVEKIVLDEFRKVSKNLSEKELAQVKEQMIGNEEISMEDSQSQMVNLIMAEISGKAEDVYEFEKNIRSVKLEDVKNLSKKATENYSLFVLEAED